MDDGKRELIRLAKQRLTQRPGATVDDVRDTPPADPRSAAGDTRARVVATCSITMRRFVMVFRPTTSGQPWLLCDGEGILPSDVSTDAAGTSVVMRGALATSGEYRGCPYCKSRSFLMCCRQLACLGATQKRNDGLLYCPASDHWSQPTGSGISNVVATVGGRATERPALLGGGSATPQLPAPPRR